MYDIIERVHRRFQDIDEESPRKKLAKKFEQSINEFFIDEGIGWQLLDGEVVTRGPEAFETSVHQARSPAPGWPHHGERRNPRSTQ